MHSILRIWEKNPLAYFLVVLLSLSVFFHYRTGKQFSHVCNLFADLQRDYIDLSELHTYDAFMDLQALELMAIEHERLMTEETREGREYRWRFRTTRDIETACARRSQVNEPFEVEY